MSNHQHLPLLERHHQFPGPYTFKFIVATQQKKAVMAMMPGATLQERPSRRGKYIALSFTQNVQSANQVMAIYHQVAALEGVISL